MNNKKGFTLVELVAVLVILGILMLIAVPSMSKLSEKIKNKKIKNDAVVFESLVKSLILKDTSIEIPENKQGLFTLNSINKKALSETYDEDYSYILVSECSMNDSYIKYTCNNYEVYLYSKINNRYYSDGTIEKGVSGTNAIEMSGKAETVFNEKIKSEKYILVDK